jgi:hypothetical protein
VLVICSGTSREEKEATTKGEEYNSVVHKQIETCADCSTEGTSPDGERESNKEQTKKLSQVVCFRSMYVLWGILGPFASALVPPC